MSSNLIKAAPDYLSLRLSEFIGHFINLKTRRTYPNWIQYSKYTKLLGYSCRSLFETCMQFFDRPDLTVVTTPLNHTSFRNIIEDHVNPKNIHVIEFNDTYNGLGNIPILEKCDIVILTHMFGQDLDLSPLQEFKKKHKCIIIEDRVQGGPSDLKFSSELGDIALYSMAMDKRPIALGGGYMNVSNHHNDLINFAKNSIANLPTERVAVRYKEMLKKIPTYLLYNSRLFIFLFIHFLKLLNRFNRDINLLNITKSYRKSNPGFSHGDFMWKPSNSLLKSMYENFSNYSDMERNYAKKHLYFMECFPTKIRTLFFPWFKGTPSLTPYNAILLNESLVDPFLSFFNNNDMSVITNPTYKIFNFPVKFSERDEHFCNGIVYLPSLANMKEFEIRNLASYIIQFFRSYCSTNSEKSKKKQKNLTTIPLPIFS